jgi:RNA polymerase sigma factor (sigma-70 family)
LYAALRSPEERNALACAHLPLAYDLAWRLARTRPALVHRLGGPEDVIQTACVALLRAAELWDPARGEFTTYATACMRGQVLQAVRAADLIRLPDSLRREARSATRRRLRVARLAAGDPGGEEILDPAAPAGPDPAEAEERAALLGRLLAALPRLPERQRAVLVLCDLGGLRQEDAGRRLGCSKQWVSALRARALAGLRRLLGVRRAARAPGR